MNHQSDSNASDSDALHNTLVPTPHDVPRVSSSAFLDDTRHDDADGEASKAANSPRDGALWLLLSLIAFYSVFSLGAWSQKHSSKPPIVGPFTPRSEAAKTRVVVHVAGAVQHPGVYTLNSNARVFEALHLAGGALPQAETDALNLAGWAQDGTRIEVPFKAKTLRTASTVATTPVATPKVASEATTSNGVTSAIEEEATVAPAESSTTTLQDDTKQSASAQSHATKTATPKLIGPQSSTRLPRATGTKAEKPRRSKGATKAQSKTVAGLPRALTPDGKLSDNASPQYLEKHPLDLNKITREQLEALPGVGPSLAQKILDYRAQNKGFKNVDELDNVSGIGAKKLAALRPLLYVVGAKASADESPSSATAP